MPRKTDGEKIDELEKLVATLSERMDYTRKGLDEHRTELAALAKALADVTLSAAILRRDLDELRTTQKEMKREQEEASRKRWSLLPPVISAVFSGIISALVAYFVAHK